LISRYGRTMENMRTASTFQAILNILTGSRCLADNQTLQCGDAVAYVLPTLPFEIGDLIKPVLGRGKWRIISEKWASRIGNLRIFRTLGLERYTPGIALEGIYDIAFPAEIVLESSYNIDEAWFNLEMVSVYAIISESIAKELNSSYTITKTPTQVTGERAIATGVTIDNYWNPWNDDDLGYYKVHRSTSPGFTPSDANLVGIPASNSFRHNALAAATTYYFKVCTVTKLGVSGAYSAQFNATTA